MDDSAGVSGSESRDNANQIALATAKAMSAKEITILNVCETAQGGVGRYQDAMSSLAEHGIDCHILLPDSDVGILIDPSHATTFTRTKRGPVALLRLLRAFLAERRRMRPDVYFFHSTFALLPLMILRLIGDASPTVYCAHCWATGTIDTETLKKKVIRQIEGRLCGLADLVVNVSHSDAKMARQNGYRGKHVVVENAVAEPSPNARSDLFMRASTDTINLLFVGRFDRQKGLDILLDAFQIAQTRNSNLALHLVGDPVRSGELPAFPSGVSHHGWIAPSQIDNFYRSADALVVPSRWEGLPLVIPEAYRSGTPVLVARTSGMEHLVEENVTGCTFDLGSAELGRLLTSLDRSHLIKMRPYARAFYENRFSLDRFSGELAMHLRTLVSDVQIRKNR